MLPALDHDGEREVKRYLALLLFFITICSSLFCSDTREWTYNWGDWQEQTQSSVVPTLDFDNASYYEFGFSSGPVDVNNNVTPITNGVVELHYTESEDGESITIPSDEFYIYWKMIARESVTLSLEVDGKLRTEDGLSDIDWSLSWKDDDLNSSGTIGGVNGDYLNAKDVVTISARTSYEANDIQYISSSPITYSFNDGNPISIASLSPEVYSARVTLGIRSGE